MRLCSILPSGSVVVDAGGSLVHDKDEALHVVAGLLSSALGTEAGEVERMLRDREALQSTGIGDGVAIPHAAMSGVNGRAAALVLCPRGVEFSSIDGAPARIILGVVGPKEGTGDHLRILARVSKLLRDPALRQQLLQSATPGEAYQLLENRDAALP